MQLSDTQAAYLAALIDGEGALMLVRQRYGKNGRPYRYSPRLEIGMTDNALLAIADEYQFGTIRHRKQRSPRHKPLNLWTLSANALRILLPQVIPYLRFKRTQAELLKRYLDTLQGGEAIYAALSQLNRRGTADA